MQFKYASAVLGETSLEIGSPLWSYLIFTFCLLATHMFRCLVFFLQLGRHLGQKWVLASRYGWLYQWALHALHGELCTTCYSQ